MATFTITTSVNIDSLASKTGGDLYNINGGTLTIDQDSRVGTNQTTSSTLGNITISSSLGGTLNIDGTDIWMIPYSSGSGNVPAWNTTITNNTGTGLLIGVHSALTAASTATGDPMPATGFIRVKQKSGAYAAGALTGISATADDAGRVGWIELVGDESVGVIANRLGSVNIMGEWYEVGTTSGSSNQTMQIPNNGLLRYVGGVFIEKTVGGGDFEFYPNAGTTTTTGTEASRGKVVWIDNTGLVRIGDSGAGTNGYTPVSGLRVVVGNIFLENCTTAARTANVIPNATVATRFDFITTGGGIITGDKFCSAWYASFNQAYSLTLSNCSWIDSIFLNEIATAVTFTKVGVGNKPTTALLVSGLIATYCYAGGTFTDCVWSRVSMATSSSHSVSLTDCAGFTFINDTTRANTIKANTTTYSHICTRLKNCTWTTPNIVQGPMSFITCENITVTDIIYSHCVSGTTPTTSPSNFFLLSSSTTNCLFSGGTIPVTNTHPYASLITMSNGCSNIRFRNIGTRASPLNLGSANTCSVIYAISAGCSDIYIKRAYVSNTRNGVMTGDNTCKNIIEENVYGDFADTDVSPSLNFYRKGVGATLAYTAQTSVYGTHWISHFTSTTVGRLAIMMNEPSAETTSQVTLSNGASFTSVGSLYMPVIGHTATFETPYYVLGHTAFTNSDLVMAGGTVGNYRFEYSIDLNDGAGWSTMTTSSYTAAQLGTALNGETLDASLGFKLRLKITTGTTNTTAITSVYMPTTSSTTAQDYQYALDPVTIKATVLDALTFDPIQNARVYLTASGGGPQADGTTLLTGLTDASGILQDTGFAYLGDQDFMGTARKATSGTRYKPAATNGTITEDGLDLTIFLISDE